MPTHGTQPSQTLASLLQSLIPDPAQESLRTSVLPSLLDSVSKVARSLRQSRQVSLTGTANAFDDQQLNVDLSAEECIQDVLRRCPSIATFSSEEVPAESIVRHTRPADLDRNPGETYTVAYDPLDGSSIIPANWAVGTIIGVWKGNTALGQVPREGIVAAILGVYGPRTTAIVSLRQSSGRLACFEVGLDEEDTGGVAGCTVTRQEVALSKPPFQTRYFAPANLRAAADDPRYMGLVQHYVSRKYTLRYSGGLVPDVVHALVKGHGVYVSPVTERSRAKLRRLYELCPVAFIVEGSGGRAMDPVTGTDVLATEVRDCDERGGLLCGNKEEVEEAIKMLL